VVNVDLSAATFSEGIELGALALVMSERLTAIITIGAAWGGIVDGCAAGRTSIIFFIQQPGMQRATAGIALDAALEIRGKLREISVITPCGNEPAEWAPRISIASGPCIVGTFVGTFVGNTTQHCAAIGPAVHVASVLHAATSPGTIVCDHATWLLVNDCVQGTAPRAAAGARDLPRHYEISGFASSARSSRRAAAAANHAGIAVVPRRVLRREGEYWTILCGDAALHFKDSKGVRALARLLANPHVEIHVLELASDIADSDVGRSGPTTSGTDRVHHETGGPVLDDRAKAEYRARLRYLDDEIDEAQRWADAGRAARAEAEKHALAHQLAAALGLGGRDRKLPSLSERARVNLTRTIRTSIDSIATSHPDLGAHLRASIRTGTFCSYSPHPGVSGDWRIE